MTSGPGTGGLPPRRPDQQHDPAPPSGAPGGASGVFKGRLIIISGNAANGSTGLFAYSPSPGPGNLIVSIASVAGTDPYGNAYPSGINLQPGATRPNENLVPNLNKRIDIKVGSSSFTGLIQPATLYGSGDVNEVQSGLVASCLFNVGLPNQFPALLLSSAVLNVAGPGILTGAVLARSTSDNGAIQAQTDLGQLATIGGILTFTSSMSLLQAIGGTNQLVVSQQSLLMAADPTVGSFTQPEVWKDLTTFAAGYSVGGFAKYRANPVNGTIDLAIRNLVHDGVTANPDGTTIVTAGNGLPAIYRPISARRLSAWTNLLRSSGTSFESAALEIETDGSIQCYGMAVGSTRVDCYGATIPLDI